MVFTELICSLLAVFQAAVVSKLLYASRTWRGFPASVANGDRLEASGGRQLSASIRPQAPQLQRGAQIEADEKLHIYQLHLLYHLLQLGCNTHNSLRPRAHDFTLSFRIASFGDKITRIECFVKIGWYFNFTYNTSTNFLT